MQHDRAPEVRTAILIAAMISGPMATGAAEAASWSPDGRLIAYSYIGGPENIYIVPADGGTARSIVAREQRDFRPEWSPDGSHLVFTTVIDGVHAIMRVDADGENLRQLTRPEEAAGDPDYSPDGRRLLYFTDEPRPRDLFVRDVASGRITALTDTPDFEEASPRWHPDGRQVVFVGKATGENLESDIWVLDTETGERRNLTGTASVGEFHPDWSHDGSRVVYVRTENGVFDVAMRNVSSGRETVVASGKGFAVLDPHFSPDDSEVTFTRTDFAEKGEGMPAVVAVSLQHGAEREIARGLYLSQIAAMEKSFSDARDGNTYGTVDIAGMRWMTENLRYDAAGSVCYDNLQSNCDRYGRLYSWEVALQACPEGWHLSTDFEWQKLELALGVPFEELSSNRERGEPAGDAIKATGEHPLKFLFAGYSDPEGQYRKLGETAALWTATEADLNHAWHRDLDASRSGIYRSRVYKPWLLSLRCVANRGAS